MRNNDAVEVRRKLVRVNIPNVIAALDGGTRVIETEVKDS